MLHASLRWKNARTWLSMLALALIILGPVHLGRADFHVRVTPADIPVHISGDFAQGVPSRLPNTTTLSLGTIPFFEGRVFGANATILTALLNKAITAKTPGAAISGTTFAASSNAGSVHYDLDFTVSGVSHTNDVNERVDLAWRSFAISDDFSVGNASLNHLFPTYLRSQLLFFVQAPATGLVQVTKFLYLNGRGVPQNTVPGLTKNLFLFNFSSLSLPLQLWGATHPNSSTTLLQSTTGFNVTFLQTFNEAGEIARINWNAVYKLNATIEAPHQSTVSADQIEFETSRSTGIYQIMLAVIVGSVGMLALAIVMETRIQNKGRQGKRKRKD